ncbi:hypothetical protein [Myxococcus qinghaiensis]|uniref:hypothetical protein n=1 Tax=Myxococcus qinghaiensis TaxID=2906758 RepID=UPI0020A77207|nr:hypothetical protein [Myxococcus qinghaiensis]MCP3167643.1 hypothetical protein [Myxococcus qinghaiensis]
MTKYALKPVTCAVCDSVSEQRTLQCVTTFERPDLDGRPSEMARSTMDVWVQTCPACGYCAMTLTQAAPSARNVVQSEAYRTRLHHPGAPALLNQFMCLALLQDAEGLVRDSAQVRTHAAWVADDAGLEDLARRCRSEAADLLLNAPPLKHWERREEPDWQGWRGVQLVDLLRRAGRGEEALREVERIRQVGASSLMKQLLTYESAAIARGDTGRHTVNEGLGLPLPPERRPANDPLLQYLLDNYWRLVTDTESKAARMETFNTEEGPRWATDNPEVLALLAEGKAGLGRALERRLLAEHPDTVIINRCPKCGAPARTSKARQCRACPHTWRESPR